IRLLSPLTGLTLRLRTPARPASRPLPPDPAEIEFLTIEPRLHGLTRELGWNGLENPEHTGDGDELRVEFLAKHTSRGVLARTRHRTTAKGSVDVHATVGNDLRARTHRRGNDEVPTACIHALS